MVKIFDALRNAFLRFLFGKDKTKLIAEHRKDFREPSWAMDSRIKLTCFLLSLVLFVPFSILVFRHKHWSINVFELTRIGPTIFGAFAGLLSALLIGIGLIANLLISYAHSIEARLFFSLNQKSERAVVGLNKDEREERWKEYNLHIDLYKYYLELGLKANLFFYLITGTILGFYLTHDVKYKKVSLLLPILLSLALGGIFIHSALLWIRLSRIIRGIRRELNILKAPDINLMTALLFVFGFITLTVGVAMILLVIVT